MCRCADQWVAWSYSLLHVALECAAGYSAEEAPAGCLAMRRSYLSTQGFPEGPPSGRERLTQQRIVMSLKMRQEAPFLVLWVSCS